MKRTLKSITSFGLFLMAFVCFSGSEPSAFGREVLLEWNPNAEPDLAGYRIYYSKAANYPFDAVDAAEGISPIDASNATSMTVTGLDPTIDYYFAVTAYNTSGIESAYSAIKVIPGLKDLLAPVVALTSPSPGATVSGVVAITARASDDVGVAKIELYENGNLVSAGNVSPFTYQWDTLSLSNGSHSITAKAYDAAGNVSVSSEDVVILNDVSAPTVSIASPTAGTTVGGAVVVSANVGDNVGVSRVEFYLNDSLQAQATAPPYIFNWNTAGFANGSYTVAAKAYDAAGNVGNSGSVPVTILNDTTAPTITFLSPTATYIYAQKVNVGATAADNVSVARIELYVDGVLKSTTMSASVSQTVSLNKGAHTIEVRAYDTFNNVGTKTLTINRIF